MSRTLRAISVLALLLLISSTAAAQAPTPCDWPGAGHCLQCPSHSDPDLVADYWPITREHGPDKLTEAFGPRVRDVAGTDFDYHEGVDIKTGSIKAVHAPWTGWVVGTDSGQGLVILRHKESTPDANTVYTGYLHLTIDSKFNALTAGKRVEAGEHFANSGDTDTAHHHLHFMTMVGGSDTNRQSVNPIRYNSVPYSDTALPAIRFDRFFEEDGTTKFSFVVANPAHRGCEQGCADQLHFNRIKITDPNAYLKRFMGLYHLVDDLYIDFDRRRNDDSPYVPGSGGEYFENQERKKRVGNADGRVETLTGLGFPVSIGIAPLFYANATDDEQQIRFTVSVPEQWKGIFLDESGAFRDWRNLIEIQACTTWKAPLEIADQTCNDYCLTERTSCGAGGAGFAAAAEGTNAAVLGNDCDPRLWIDSPRGGESVTVDTVVPVKVTVTDPDQVSAVQVSDDLTGRSFDGTPDAPGSAKWTVPWTVPSTPDQPVRLTASASYRDGRPLEISPPLELRTTAAVDQTPPQVPVFVFPSPSEAKVGQSIRVVARDDRQVRRVSIQYRPWSSGAPFEPLVDITTPDSGTSDTFSFTMPATGDYGLLATAYDGASPPNQTSSPETFLRVLPGSRVSIAISPESPRVGQQVTITVTAPAETTGVRVEVSTLGVGTELLKDDADGHAPWVFSWPQAKSGSNTIRASAFLQGGGIDTNTRDVDVTDASAPKVDFRKLFQKVGNALVPYPVDGAVLKPGFDVFVDVFTDDDDLQNLVLSLEIEKPDGSKLPRRYPVSPCDTATKVCRFLWLAGEQGAPGVYKLIATATDAVPNQTTRTVSVRLDPSAPAGPLVWLNVAQTSPPQVIPSRGFPLRLHAASNGYLYNRITVNVTLKATGVGVFQASWDQDTGPLEGDHVFDFKSDFEGEHVVDAFVARITGNGWLRMADAPSVTVNVRDVNPPTVRIQSPTAGTPVEHRIPVIIEARDNLSLSSVELVANNTTVATLSVSGSSATVAVPWCPSHVNPTMKLQAKAVDGSGNEVGSSTVEVDVRAVRCSESPLVRILAPSPLRPVDGRVPVETWTDPSVTTVDFAVDGQHRQRVEAAPFRWLWDASCAPNGTHRLTVTADGGDTESVDVTLSNTNHPPQWAPLAPTQAVEVGTRLDLDLSATDQDCSDTVTLAASGLPTGAVFGSTPGTPTATGRLSWTPTRAQAGGHTLSFTAQDSRGATSTESTSVTVFCRAHAELAAPDPGGPYFSEDVVSLRLVEPCGQISWQLTTVGPVEYDVVSGCQAGATCVVRVRDLLPNKIGPDKIVRVQATARDTMGGTATDTVDLKLAAERPPENHPPTMNPIPDQSATVGAGFAYEVEANDDDEDFLVLTASALPPGATFQTVTSMRGYVMGRFSWTPSVPGSFLVTFTAQEKEADEPLRTGETVSRTMRITATSAVPRPDLTVQAHGWPSSAAEGTPLNFVYTVGNVGTAEAAAGNGGFATRLYFGSTPGPEGRITALAAGSSNTTGLAWTPPGCGPYKVHLRTDADNVVTESREDNNQTPPHTLNVTCANPMPDLVVESVTVTPNPPAAGSFPRFVAAIRNAGPAAAPASVTRLRIDENADGTWDVSDATPMATGPLAPGVAETETWLDDWAAVIGSHRVEVCADAGGAVPENGPGGESNNCASLSFVVKGGK